MSVAKKVIYQIVDDLDGAVLEPGEGETVNFALDGGVFEIDLSDVNAEVLRDILRPYVEAGRKVKAADVKAKRVPVASDLDLAAVRAWAREHGHQVSDRGRVPTAIVDEYRSAHL